MADTAEAVRIKGRASVEQLVQALGRQVKEDYEKRFPNATAPAVVDAFRVSLRAHGREFHATIDITVPVGPQFVSFEPGEVAPSMPEGVPLDAIIRYAALFEIVGEAEKDDAEANTRGYSVAEQVSIPDVKVQC